MKLLSKFFLAPLLLTVVFASWAACPEGTKNNYKGECVPTAGSESPASSGSLSSVSGWKFVLSLKVGAKKHDYQVVSASDHPVCYGKYSEKFEVRAGDCSWNNDWDDCKSDRERSALTQPDKDQQEGDEYRYRWSIYFPEDHQKLFPTKLAYTQLKNFGSSR